MTLCGDTSRAIGEPSTAGHLSGLVAPDSSRQWTSLRQNSCKRSLISFVIVAHVRSHTYHTQTPTRVHALVLCVAVCAFICPWSDSQTPLPQELSPPAGPQTLILPSVIADSLKSSSLLGPSAGLDWLAARLKHV